ncbi:MAG: hypothetical protein JOZ24_00125 [Candidatus Eremiobacteraeota bacterium]|nr:hypothetical protein [Candidatus Eremiobacteraeota bacterium]
MRTVLLTAAGILSSLLCAVPADAAQYGFTIFIKVHVIASNLPPDAVTGQLQCGTPDAGTNGGTLGTFKPVNGAYTGDVMTSFIVVDGNNAPTQLASGKRFQCMITLLNSGGQGISGYYTSPNPLVGLLP